MTDKEAIIEIKEASNSEIRYGDVEHHYAEIERRVEAFEMAINALEAKEEVIKKFEELRKDCNLGCAYDHRSAYRKAIDDCIRVVKGAWE